MWKSTPSESLKVLIIIKYPILGGFYKLALSDFGVIFEVKL